MLLQINKKTGNDLRFEAQLGDSTIAYIVGIAIIVSAKVFPTAETSTFQLLRKSSLPFSLAFLAQELNENDFIPNIYVCSRYKSNTIFLVKINNISVV